MLTLAQTTLAQAQLQLSYTQVRAPIAGRLSRAEITAGNVVSAGSDAAPLTRIVSDGRLYAAFNVDEQSYPRTLAPTLRSGAKPERRAEAASSRVALSAKARFDEGDADYLVVVDAERTLLRSRLSRLQSEGERARATVDLVRALGGGWQAQS